MLQKLPQDGMLVHHRSLPRNLIGFPNTSPVPIYSHGWREALWELSVLTKNTLTKCPRPELQHGPLAPGTSALIMRPLRVHITTLSDWSKKRNSHYFLIQSGVKRALDALANVFPRFSATHVYLLQCFISSVDYLDLLRLTSLISTDFFFGLMTLKWNRLYFNYLDAVLPTIYWAERRVLRVLLKKKTSSINKLSL